MTKSALVCLAPGSEEIEAVTTIDLLIRADIDVTTASVADDGNLTIVCSRGVKLIVDIPLVNVADKKFDVIVLPGGLKGAECFQNNPLLIEKIRQTHLDGNYVAAICASPALVLEYHNLFPDSNMTGYPALKNKIVDQKWVDRRVCYDKRFKLITSQGPGTTIDFSLKIIECLQGAQKAAEVAKQLILPHGIYDYQSINDEESQDIR